MTTKEQAREIALAHVRAAAIDLPDGDELVIADESTIERSWGWVFFYSSKLWLQTREARFALAGNAPLIVARETGRVTETGTALPFNAYIEQYEKSQRVRCQSGIPADAKRLG
jgi:hypothetical protein